MVDSSSPATRCFAITPSDTDYLATAGDTPLVTRGILVTVAGNIEVQFIDSPHGTYHIIPVLASVVYPFAVERVIDANTTATGIFGFH